ncbi:MAG: THxN family PEP-CTERM protein [Coleofasciculus sp. G3-WIS-01]|uniref:THxN family PEP-CTERM protein n=1 Tax=Coleofasciculus sp. G3-WIS-01 TaxID=3069528 RepID=UPI0032F39493
MKFNLSTLTKTTLSGVAITATLGCLASSVDALTLASSSGSWSNVVLDNGLTVNPPGSNTVEFLSVGNENQILWGVPAVGSPGKSGLGFAGVENKSFSIGEVFEVGTLRHFNTPILASSPGANTADLGITLDISTVDLEQAFTFNVIIDETLNSTPCQYASDPGNPCSDKVSFSNTVSSSTFLIDGIEYNIELLGFRDTPTGTSINKLITQEDGTNQTKLFAKITTEKVPEPTAMVGLSLLGLYIMGRRNQKQKLH